MRIFRRIVRGTNVEFPLQAIDDDSAQTAQMTAGLLNWPQAVFASKVNEF